MSCSCLAVTTTGSAPRTPGKSLWRNWNRRFVCNPTTRLHTRRSPMAWLPRTRSSLHAIGGIEARGRAEGHRARPVACRRACGACRASSSTIGTGTARSSNFRRRLELNPESIDVCGCYGNVLAAFGRFDDAIRIVEQGIRVNPLSTELRNNYGFVLYMARRYSGRRA